MKIYLLIAGMALVTYIPRLLPMVLPERLQFPIWLDRWLQYVPYAALGALIFPGVLASVDGRQPWLGLLGGFTAGLLALAGLNILIVLAGAIAVVAVALSII
ncbi:Branched-chain amino acid transport protein (AzlD) [Pelotomaculum schinkii]|uniref:Branched-chain amino acid transport protein (AzlD) n=1 Tax=Pelotomaculum schinkii TaxID=78350 RepID=A0A4Y7RDT5_9FIRM|nr:MULTISPECIES: AzlD domain-containing protein [Pelotomaculum]TEB06966.1 Branched-chain amino acid transport protein (AzlD) [Pelotomaculum schinkii]TEB16872.1 Branched-chain amino acid transport protein (AzlD) [Pelotomaculum sp. FP]